MVAGIVLASVGGDLGASASSGEGEWRYGVRLSHWASLLHRKHKNQFGFGPFLLCRVVVCFLSLIESSSHVQEFVKKKV